MHASVLSLASLILLQLQVAPGDSVQLQPLRPAPRASTEWGPPVTSSAPAPLRGSFAQPRGVALAESESESPVEGPMEVPADERRDDMPAPPPPPSRPPTHSLLDMGNRDTREIERATAPASRPAMSLPHASYDGVSRVNYQSERAAPTAPLLVKHALTVPEDDTWRLPGQGLALYTALERVGERTTRVSLVRSYWRMTADVAAYYWSVEEGSFVAGLQPAGRGDEGGLLTAARLEAQGRLQQAKVTAAASQNELAELARLTIQDPPPLPVDIPLVSAYQTKFDRIFASRTPPAGLRRIAYSIPLQLELVETLAATVAADTDLVKDRHQEHRQGQVALADVLAAHDRLHRHRVEFLQAVRVYNELIAEYALAIAGTTNNQTLVSMLIRNPATPRTSQVPRTSGVRDAGSGYGNRGYSDNSSAVRSAPAGTYPSNTYPGNSYPGRAPAGSTYPNGAAPAGSYPSAPGGGGAAATGTYPGTGPGTRTSAGGSGPPPPPNAAGPRTSSRGGTWMAPRTTVRDNAVRGSSTFPEAGMPLEGQPQYVEGAPEEPQPGADGRPVLGAPYSTP